MDALNLAGIGSSRRDRDDTAALDSDALVAHDLADCVLATEPQPPLLTDADRTRPGRRLRVLVDVTADVTSHLNLLPVSDQHELGRNWCGASGRAGAARCDRDR